MNSVEFVDLVALRPIRRKDGTKAVRMADGTLLEVTMPRTIVYGTEKGELHPAYLWRIAFVIALLDAGYKVLSAKEHVLEITKLPTDVSPLTERRLIKEAIDARSTLPFKNPKGPGRPAVARKIFVLI